MNQSNGTGSNARTGGQILIDQLRLHGADMAFCVPGESYLAALDAFYDAPDIKRVVCRQEGGATMMADAYGKLTGRPGIAFVTRGPGATNASAGVHIGQQDSTPMILFIGQVGRSMLGREALRSCSVLGERCRSAGTVTETPTGLQKVWRDFKRTVVRRATLPASAASAAFYKSHGDLN